MCPKENDEVNLSWLSDRSHGYEGISSKDRAQNPLIRNNEILEKLLQSGYNRFRVIRKAFF